MLWSHPLFIDHMVINHGQKTLSLVWYDEKIKYTGVETNRRLEWGGNSVLKNGICKKNRRALEK